MLKSLGLAQAVVDFRGCRGPQLLAGKHAARVSLRGHSLKPVYGFRYVLGTVLGMELGMEY